MVKKQEQSFIKELKEINFFNIFDWIKLFYKHKYFHFFLTGVTGVLINTFFAWFFVEFIFTNDIYNLDFYSILIKNTSIGIIIGTAANLIYNFILHTKINFKTEDKHKRRFCIFILYSLFMSYIVIFPITLLLRNFLEYILIDTRFSFIQEYSYLIANGVVIFIFSFVNFFFFKFVLFKNKK